MNDKPIGIIGAMPQEVKTLTKRLETAKTTEIAGMTLVSGTLNGTAVVVMQSGIGKVNAAVATTLMISRYQPTAIINTGSAGGISDGLAVGDVVIGQDVTHHDVDVAAFGYAVGQMPGMPESYPGDSRLLALATQAATSFPAAAIHCGQIVSGDQFIASSSRFAAIKTAFPQALAVEMEAAAIAQTCYRFAIPFVVVRAISDLADEQASLSFDEFIEQASKHSADMVVRLVGKLAESA